MIRGRKEAIVVFERVGAVKPGGQTVAVHVPRARVIIAVAQWFEKRRQHLCPARSHAVRAADRAEHAVFAAVLARQEVAADRLGIVAGEQGGAGGPAAGGVVELGKTKSTGGESIEADMLEALRFACWREKQTELVVDRAWAQFKAAMRFNAGDKPPQVGLD